MPMLKRLRIRLVAIIVGLVGAVFLCMVALTYMSSEASLNTLVDHSLAGALQERTGFDAGAGSNEPMGMDRLPVIWVDIASGGLVLGTNQEQVSIDADLLRETVANALESGQTSGKDKTNHISWRMDSSKFGWRIAIADTTSVDEEISSQLVRSLELGAGGIVAIVLIALLLSHWALKPVERAWEQQRQFVADASHELKTPLAVILANTQILKSDESKIPEESRRWIEGASDEAERMRGLVEELLELARTEGGASNARANAPVDLSSLVEGDALQFDAVAYERGCEIETNVVDGISVLGDQDQLDRLLKTLVDNACKYATRGTQIKVTLEKNGSHALFIATNEGEPIPEEDLPRVFDRFWRSDKARARSTGGYGLGLAIAKGIAESHGGKIWATSDDAQGTSFYVKLPINERA
ncbi:cell wall metabolism sensor histidine kinase WalK [uncultured Parolsenella sp.]|uniref:sensor histidine kinase n=1 Tax=uncultured Parolsenella sp. TaxID=2083008 RepID=UPI0025D3CCD1|nr:HAMP domain-containing sensor histidine kinase [uncultured Parolsenella sp.]